MLKKSILYGHIVNACIKVFFNRPRIHFIVRASPEAASVNKHNQRCRVLRLSFSEIYHLVGVIPIGHIFVGHLR